MDHAAEGADIQYASNLVAYGASDYEAVPVAYGADTSNNSTLIAYGGEQAFEQHRNNVKELLEEVENERKLGSKAVPHKKYNVKGVSIEKLYNAILSQESNNNYTAINWDPNGGKDPAIGLGQVLASNVRSWTKQALGYSVDPHTFRFSKRIQQLTIRHRLSIIANQQRAAGIKDEHQIVRRTAAVWYSGQSRLWNDKRVQYCKVKKKNKIIYVAYPSIGNYTQSIWNKYQRS